jgi:CO dehydrogenase nickel-insertion accessory protein CooC1
MNIADKLKSNIVVIPVVASIVVGSFTGIKYIVNLTSTINDNKQEIVLLHNRIDEANEKLKKAQEDISNIFGIIQMSKEIMEIMGSQVSDLQWEVRDLSR